MITKNNSPYSAAITGGGFLYEETGILLPLLQSENSEELLRDEAVNNRLLHINSESSRKRNISEIKRRYNAMPTSFWENYQNMESNEKHVALLFVLLKTYKLLFDFHINVTLKRWNSISKSLSNDDLLIELNEISARDEFVDSWSEATKKRVASGYLSILKKVGMLTHKGVLKPLLCDNYDFYLMIGESWFLEACLLQPYQIEKIKKSLL